MGKTRVVPIIVIIDGQPSEWHSKAYGRPNTENLARYIHKYAKSLELGGVNEHISLALGYVPYPNKATIERQRPSRITLATWQAAMFQVW